MTTPPLSWALQEAIVQASGSAFWWKNPLRQLLLRAGVPGPLVNKYEGESKFKMVRFILAEHAKRAEQIASQQLAPDEAASRLKSLKDEESSWLSVVLAPEQRRQYRRDAGPMR